MFYFCHELLQQHADCEVGTGCSTAAGGLGGRLARLPCYRDNSQRTQSRAVRLQLAAVSESTSRLLSSRVASRSVVPTLATALEISTQPDC
jgi:hypothetical protein